MDGPGRRYQAGQSIEDYCRACKTDRMHTVVAVDADGRPLRVDCGFCHSEHNYRGGPRIEVSGSVRPPAAARGIRRLPPVKDAFPLVSDRERIAPPMTFTAN